MRWQENGIPEAEIQYERENLGQVPPGLWRRVAAAGVRRGLPVSLAERAAAVPRMPWFQRYKGPPGFCPPEARGDGLLRHMGPGSGLAEWHEPDNGLGQETAAAPAGWLAQITGAVTQVAEAALPVLERYGVVKPRVYTPTGGRIYTPPLPVGGAPGAAFQALTTPVAFGLTGTQILLLGAGAVALLMFLPGGRR